MAPTDSARSARRAVAADAGGATQPRTYPGAGHELGSARDALVQDEARWLADHGIVPLPRVVVTLVAAPTMVAKMDAWAVALHPEPAATTALGTVANVRTVSTMALWGGREGDAVADGDTDDDDERDGVTTEDCVTEGVTDVDGVTEGVSEGVTDADGDTDGVVPKARTSPPNVTA